MALTRFWLRRHFNRQSLTTTRWFSVTKPTSKSHSCKLLVVGGGTGGCAVAAKFAKQMKKSDLIVLEPSKYHYYQPLFTLVGGGIHTLEDSRRKEKDILPTNCTWIQSSAVDYDVTNNKVTTSEGDVIAYEYLLLAVGLELRYDRIPGLEEALQQPGAVCSNYSPKYVNKTFEILQNLKDGNAIFTFPNSPVKCPGAPQKICYITEHYLRKQGIRNKVNLIYNTSLPVLFGVKKYADALWKVCNERDVIVNLKTNLVSIDFSKNEAVFENLDSKEITKLTYSMLHVTPPMATPESLSNNKQLTNEAGFVNVDKATLQHVKFNNIFAIGDCSSTPNSKTAAAAAAQCDIVFKNLSCVMKNEKVFCKYDGYASCPLVTAYDRCILAEFDYDLKPLETFPFAQDKEMYSMYVLKDNIMPVIYWKFMMNGMWNGPALFRDVMHLNLPFKK